MTPKQNNEIMKSLTAHCLNYLINAILIQHTIHNTTGINRLKQNCMSPSFQWNTPPSGSTTKQKYRRGLFWCVSVYPVSLTLWNYASAPLIFTFLGNSLKTRVSNESLFHKCFRYLFHLLNAKDPIALGEFIH